MQGLVNNVSLRMGAECRRDLDLRGDGADALIKGQELLGEFANDVGCDVLAGHDRALGVSGSHGLFGDLAGRASLPDRKSRGQTIPAHATDRRRCLVASQHQEGTMTVRVVEGTLQRREVPE